MNQRTLSVRIFFGVVLAFLSLSLGMQNSLRAAPPAKADAVKVADSWLKLVDAGKYDQSWREGAEMFRNAVKVEAWREMVGKARTPFGKVLSRKFHSKQEKTSLPGAPDGKYVVIEYHTSFEHKNEAVETVTPTLEKDGKWHVGGYLIR